MESYKQAEKSPFQKSQKHSPHRRPMLVLQPIALAENICGNVYCITCVVVILLPAVKATSDRGALLREQFLVVN